MNLPYNGNLKLTTSKYYIPSGRCIQAINYKHNNGGYIEHVPDSLTHLFHTANGREVRDGGGIKPDIEILPDSLPNIAYYLASVGRDSTEVMLNWELQYIKNHPTIAPPRLSLSPMTIMRASSKQCWTVVSNTTVRARNTWRTW